MDLTLHAVMTRWLDARFLKTVIVDVVQLISQCHHMPMHVVSISLYCWLFYKARKNSTAAFITRNPPLAHISENRIYKGREKLEFEPHEVVDIKEDGPPSEAEDQTVVVHRGPEDLNTSSEIIDYEPIEGLQNVEEEKRLKCAVTQINIVVGRLPDSRWGRKYVSSYTLPSAVADDKPEGECSLQTSPQRNVDIAVPRGTETCISISTSRRGSEARENRIQDDADTTGAGEGTGKTLTQINIVLKSGSQTSSSSRSRTSDGINEREPQELFHESEGLGSPLRRCINFGDTSDRSVSEVCSSNSSLRSSGIQEVVDEAQKCEETSEDLPRVVASTPNVQCPPRISTRSKSCERGWSNTSVTSVSEIYSNISSVRSSEGQEVVDGAVTSGDAGDDWCWVGASTPKIQGSPRIRTKSRRCEKVGSDDEQSGSLGQLPDIALHGSCCLTPSGNITDPAILLGLAQVELKKEQSVSCQLRRRVAELEERLDTQTSSLLQCELEKVALEERLRDVEDALGASQEMVDDLRRELEANRVAADVKETTLLSAMGELEEAVEELHREVSFREELWMHDKDEELSSEVEGALRSFCLAKR